MANKNGVCAECGKERALAARGLCFACYKDRAIRAKHGRVKRGTGMGPAKAAPPALTAVTTETPTAPAAPAPAQVELGLLGCLVEFADTQHEATVLLGDLNEGIARLREANHALRLALIKSREEVMLARKALTRRTGGK